MDKTLIVREEINGKDMIAKFTERPLLMHGQICSNPNIEYMTLYGTVKKYFPQVEIDEMWNADITNKYGFHIQLVYKNNTKNFKMTYKGRDLGLLSYEFFDMLHDMEHWIKDLDEMPITKIEKLAPELWKKLIELRDETYIKGKIEWKPLYNTWLEHCIREDMENRGWKFGYIYRENKSMHPYYMDTFVKFIDGKITNLACSVSGTNYLETIIKIYVKTLERINKEQSNE